MLCAPAAAVHGTERICAVPAASETFIEPTAVSSTRNETVSLTVAGEALFTTANNFSASPSIGDAFEIHSGAAAKPADNAAGAVLVASTASAEKGMKTKQKKAKTKMYEERIIVITIHFSIPHKGVDNRVDNATIDSIHTAGTPNGLLEIINKLSKWYE
jgi:hypothetical protein